MAIGLVSSDEFEDEFARLDHFENRPKKEVYQKVIAAPSNSSSLTKVIEKEIARGRGSVEEKSDSLRALVAQEAILGTPHKVISAEFGVSQSSISAYKDGKTSTAAKEKNEVLVENNAKTREVITGSAFNKLKAAIEAIDENKLAESSPKVAAQIAQQMSSIVKNISVQEEEKVNIGNVIIYKPRMKEESEFEVIDIQAIER